MAWIARLAPLVACAAFAGIAPDSFAQTPGDAEISFTLDSIRIEDEDDPLSNDEPYAVMIGFEADLTGRVRTRVLTGGHNNLGRRGDNWADEVHTYSLPVGIPRGFTAYLPADQIGLAGAVVVHMEEDGFHRTTATVLAQELRRQLHAALTAGAFGSIDSGAIETALTRHVLLRFNSSLRRVDLAGLVRGLASAADPDDYGGVQVVVAARAGARRLSYVGVPPAGEADLLSSLQPLAPGCRSTRLSYPAGNLRETPWNARFAGRHIYGARLCNGTFTGLY